MKRTSATYISKFRDARADSLEIMVLDLRFIIIHIAVSNVTQQLTVIFQEPAIQLFIQKTL